MGVAVLQSLDVGVILTVACGSIDRMKENI